MQIILTKEEYDNLVKHASLQGFVSGEELERAILYTPYCGQKTLEAILLTFKENGFRVVRAAK